MAADVKLLPLPELPRQVEGYNSDYWEAGQIEEYAADYARANVAHATAAKDAEIEALRAEVDEWKDVARCASEQQDSLFREALALNKRAERLAEALRDAATSMQTIADKAGRDEYLMTTDEVRGYANSRANAARAALAKAEGRSDE